MKTSKLVLLAITITGISVYAFISNAKEEVQPVTPAGKSCSITCYVKTPTCYVTKGSDECLIISNVKPAAAKKDGSKSYICTLKGCETEIDYNGGQRKEKVIPTKD